MSITEIKYFRTDGKNTAPSGVYYAKGMIYESIRKNENAFIRSNLNENFLTEKIADNQYGLSKYNGGLIVVAVSANTAIDNMKVSKIKSIFLKTYYTIMNTVFKDRKLDNLIKKWNKEFGHDDNMYIGSFSIGNFFKGKYIGDNGEVYNDKSSSIDLGGVPSELLLVFASILCREFKQETVLVKDMNKNRLYLVDDEVYDGIPEEKLARTAGELSKINPF